MFWYDNANFWLVSFNIIVVHVLLHICTNIHDIQWSSNRPIAMGIATPVYDKIDNKYDYDLSYELYSQCTLTCPPIRRISINNMACLATVPRHNLFYHQMAVWWRTWIELLVPHNIRTYLTRKTKRLSNESQVADLKIFMLIFSAQYQNLYD